MGRLRSAAEQDESVDSLPPIGIDRASSLQPSFLTFAMVKRRYSVSGSTLHKWRAEGRFPAPVKIGPRAVRWRTEDLQAFEAALVSGEK